MTYAKPSALVAAAALAGQTTYREHAHRSMAEPTDDYRETGIDEAFWPTRRGIAMDGVVIEPPIVNCQRCGKTVAPTAGWWCQDCHEIVWWLQQVRGMSMVQIAVSGEYDPPWSVWLQDHSPWLIPKRMEPFTPPIVRTFRAAEPQPGRRVRRLIRFQKRLPRFRLHMRALLGALS